MSIIENQRIGSSSRRFVFVASAQMKGMLILFNVSDGTFF